MTQDNTMNDLLGDLQRSVDRARAQSPVSTPPSTTADLTAIRYTRDGAGWRVYIGGDFLGRIEQRRVVINARGRKANRWFYTPAAWSWTVRQLDPPPAAMVQAEIGPHPGNGRPDGARLLVEHLHRHACPATATLYPGSTSAHTT